MIFSQIFRIKAIRTRETYYKTNEEKVYCILYVYQNCYTNFSTERKDCIIFYRYHFNYYCVINLFYEKVFNVVLFKLNDDMLDCKIE